MSKHSAIDRTIFRILRSQIARNGCPVLFSISERNRTFAESLNPQSNPTWPDLADPALAQCGRSLTCSDGRFSPGCHTDALATEPSRPPLRNPTHHRLHTRVDIRFAAHNFREMFEGNPVPESETAQQNAERDVACWVHGLSETSIRQRE